MSHNVEKMFTVETPSWHQLEGTPLPADKSLTIQEVLEHGGLDWSVESVPVHAELAEGFKPLDWRAVVRSDNSAILNVVYKTYAALQNREAIELMHPIVEAGNARYESAGVLRSGGRCWVLLKLPKTIQIVPGDDVMQYLLLAWGHDGSMAIHVVPTPVRVVCDNTLTAAVPSEWTPNGEKVGTNLHRVGHGIRIRHVGDVVKRVEEAKRVLNWAALEYEGAAELFQAMARLELSDKRRRSYFGRVFPTPKLRGRGAEALKTFERERAAHTRTLEKLDQLHEDGRGAALCRGRLWGAYNAVTELVDHWMVPGTASRANHVLWGEGKKLRAEAVTVARAMLN